jgi:hypothetical protein
MRGPEALYGTLRYAVVRGRWRLSAGGRGEYVAKLRGRPVAVLAQCLGYAALGYGVLTVDALGVDPEQDFDAVPGPGGYLSRRYPGIEPQRQAGVTEVVDPLGER